MNPNVVVPSLLHLIITLCLFPVPISAVKRFDMEHVVSFRHGHNAGAPAQMRIMQPSITLTRFKKSLADAEGSERHSMIEKAPGNTPDQEHKVTKRDVASVHYNERRKDQSTNKKVRDATDAPAAARDNVDQRSPRKGAFSLHIGSVSNKDNLRNINSVKHVTAKEILGHRQGKVLVFKTGDSSEEDDEEETPELPVPGFIEAPSK